MLLAVNASLSLRCFSEQHESFAVTQAVEMSLVSVSNVSQSIHKGAFLFGEGDIVLVCDVPTFLRNVPHRFLSLNMVACMLPNFQ